ncbi:MAG: hypothetical protein PWQ56_197 [Patescibacteria group bacterium]|nr:hypothetical protein [Patescibacteria group bacterium]
MKENKWKIATIILAVALIVSLVFLIKPSLKSSQKIGEDTINYINQNLLGDGTVATLEGVEKSEIIKGMYDVELGIQGQTFKSVVSGDGRYLFVDGPIDMSEGLSGEADQEDLPEMQQKESTEVEGGFKEITELDVCMENDKPIVYFFGSESCPHCAWEKPLITNVIAQFGETIDYRVRYDGSEDVDVLLKYGEGAVPTIIAGCKYYRIGSGESLGEEAEKEALTKVICRATGGVPASVCEG